MAKSLFEKTMRNVSLSDTSRTKTPRFLRKSWQFVVDIEPGDHNRLRSYMKCELAYYNSLVSGLSSRMRTMPEVLTDSNEENEKLYLACAESGFDPYDLFLMRNVDFEEGQEPNLPPQLNPFRHVFFGLDNKGARRFTDRLALMCQLFATHSPIHPLVRRSIAAEMIQFYRNQARAARQSVPLHLQADQIYKSAPESLEVHDSIIKRHLQMPKKIVSVKWNAEEERSEFKVPYTSSVLYVPNIDFVDGIKSWNHVILHQAPGGIAMGKTPWILDIRSIQGSYLLKYTDVRSQHAGAAFHQAKRGVGSRQ